MLFDPTPTVALAGGVGLVLIGIALATEGFQAAGGRVLASPLVRAAARPGRAFLLGLATALAAPGTSAQPRSVLGFASGGYLRVAPALWASLGVGATGVVVAWAVSVACLQPELGAPLALVLALCSLLAWIVPGRPVANWSRTLVGWCLTLLGAAVLAAGLIASDAPRFDVFDFGLYTRLALFAGLGIAGAALLRSNGAVVVAALTAASAGVLEVTSAAALLAGAQAGSGVGALVVSLGERGDGKRVALGLGYVQLAHAPLGVLLAVLCMPLASHPPALLAHPMVALAAFQTLLWVLGIATYVPFHRFVCESLKNVVADEQGEGAAALGLPELAVAGIEQRVEHITSVARSLARHVLGGGRISDFRLDQDRREAALLEREVAGLELRLAGQSLDEGLAARARAGAQRSQVARVLLHDLSTLREIHGQAGELSGPGAMRMRNLELGSLHLVERALMPLPDDGLASLIDEYSVVDSHRKDMQHILLASASMEGGSAPPVASAQLDVLSAIDRAVRRSVELAAVVEECPPSEASLRQWLARWLSSRAEPEEVYETA